MKKLFIFIVLIAVAVVFVWWFMASDSTTVITLSEQNNSGMQGTATITEEDGGLTVVLSLTGAPEGIAQPAHIHHNACENIGGVLYPLEFPVNGFSETRLGITMDELLADMPLSLNVHKSPAEAQVYVACGNL